MAAAPQRPGSSGRGSTPAVYNPAPCRCASYAPASAASSPSPSERSTTWPASPSTRASSSATAPSASVVRRGRGRLEPIADPLAFELDDLIGVQRPVERLVRNTEQFLLGLPVAARAALRRARHRQVLGRARPADALRRARPAPRGGAPRRPAAAARDPRCAARPALAVPALRRRPLVLRGRERLPRAEGGARRQPRRAAGQRAHRGHQQPPPPAAGAALGQPRGAPRRGRRAAPRRGARGEARALGPLRPDARLLRLRPADLPRDRRALGQARGPRASRRDAARGGAALRARAVVALRAQRAASSWTTSPGARASPPGPPIPRITPGLPPPGGPSLGVPRNMRSSAPARAASVLFAAQLLLASAPSSRRAGRGARRRRRLPRGRQRGDDFLAEYDESGAGDPLEPSNRVVFGANETIYQYIFDPLASAYGSCSRRWCGTRCCTSSRTWASRRTS